LQQQHDWRLFYGLWEGAAIVFCAEMESAAYVAYGHMKIIESLTARTFNEIVFTGGGAKGTLWPQVVADVLNCRVKVPVVKESTALGAALYAGLGAGLFDELHGVARMEFFPEFILRRNKLRGTPHYSIVIATLIPILVLLVVRGNINILGDMYAFGLLGAFSLTCLGMDIVRYRQRKYRRLQEARMTGNAGSHARQALSSTSRSAQAGEEDKLEEQALNAELTDEERANPA
jgi:hypothetical protein